jgi:hypothetical protein
MNFLDHFYFFLSFPFFHPHLHVFSCLTHFVSQNCSTEQYHQLLFCRKRRPSCSISLPRMLCAVRVGCGCVFHTAQFTEQSCSVSCEPPWEVPQPSTIVLDLAATNAVCSEGWLWACVPHGCVRACDTAQFTEQSCSVSCEPPWEVPQPSTIVLDLAATNAVCSEGWLWVCVPHRTIYRAELQCELRTSLGGAANVDHRALSRCHECCVQ